jgi:hypothetical protein
MPSTNGPTQIPWNERIFGIRTITVLLAAEPGNLTDHGYITAASKQLATPDEDIQYPDHTGNARPRLD